MTRRRTAFPLTILTVALAFAPLLAQSAPPPPQGPPPGRDAMQLDLILRALDLTADEKTSIDALLRARRAAADAARPSADAARRDLTDQIRAETFDESAIRAKAAAVAILEADGFVADAGLLRDIRAVLTDDQRQKFDRLLEPPPPPDGSPSSAASTSSTTASRPSRTSRAGR